MFMKGIADASVEGRIDLISLKLLKSDTVSLWYASKCGYFGLNNLS